jgi:hypothetical protein
MRSTLVILTVELSIFGIVNVTKFNGIDTNALSRYREISDYVDVVASALVIN